jgi:hypothetical protein
MIIGRSTQACGGAARTTNRDSAWRTGAQSHVELQMKWCRRCSAAWSSNSAAMFRIDLRPCAASRPYTYSAPVRRWSRRGNVWNIAEESSASSARWIPEVGACVSPRSSPT